MKKNIYCGKRRNHVPYFIAISHRIPDFFVGIKEKGLLFFVLLFYQYKGKQFRLTPSWHNFVF